MSTMPNTTAQCRAFSRTSLTNGLSGVFDRFTSAISKLEIDERAAAGGTEAEIQNHRNRHSNPDNVGLENLPEARLVEELVEPDHGHQDEHERRHLRIAPGCREDAAHNQQRLVQRACPEENPRKADEDEHAELFRQPRHSLLVKGGPFQLARDHDSGRVENSPDEEGPGRAVPDGGEEEREKQISIGLERAVFVSAERDIDVIPEPGREADVPARPEIAETGGEVGIVEVQDQIEAHELRHAAGHVGVAAEVEVYLPGESERG